MSASRVATGWFPTRRGASWRVSRSRPLTVDTITAAGASIAITRLPGAAPGISAEGARRFVAEALSAVASLDGRMPTDRAQLLLGPGSSRNDEPVQFGMAMRGAGPCVVLRVAPSATDASIRGEWVTVHELSHLWLPPVDRDDAWFSEGFASYYQNILRSRAGTYSEAEAWTELLAGFDRGRTEAGALPLREAQRPRFQQIRLGRGCDLPRTGRRAARKRNLARRGRRQATAGGAGQRRNHGAPRRAPRVRDPCAPGTGNRARPFRDRPAGPSRPSPTWGRRSRRSG